MLAWRSENLELNEVFLDYFEIFIENWTFNFTSYEYTKQIQFQAEKCTKDHFLEKTQNDFKDLGLETAFCLDKNYNATLW